MIAAARGSRFFSTSAHFWEEKRGAPAVTGRRTPMIPCWWNKRWWNKRWWNKRWWTKYWWIRR
ncbi:hypothetical protein Aau02nite_62170 [Amorphoplanes auranticolor]|uniref:Uncharacterized protein n=1 Tax=Actinoplanes auranticolor TaxID=47988 RepID=A0A919VSY5_9ACTN|nr:hypothetical protein Aau02nite_62170 [Actinoplanes auranticolor]